MAAIKFLNLFAVSSLALLACSFGPSPVTALATDLLHVRDVSAHGHGAIAKRKRAISTSNGKRCKVRPSSSAAPTPTPKPAQPKSSKAPEKPSSTKASSVAKSSPTTAPVTNGAAKIGISWPNGDDPSLKNFKTSKVNYLYTWSYEIPSNAKALGFKPMPMLWGPNMIDGFKKTVVKGYADIVMGFNEPNESGQSNMDPGYGASLWKEYIEPLLSQGYEAVSPATSSNPNGMVWVKNWLKACNGGCNPTYTGIHYYDVTPQGFISYIENWHTTFGKPIMATEFACQNFNGGAQCSESQVYNFMTTVVNFMESTEWVAAYFAFGVMKDMQGVNTLNQLMTSSGTPTALGKMYINGQ